MKGWEERMKKENEKMEKVIKRVITHMIDTELYGWPPQCSAFLYQPVRPKKAGKICSGTVCESTRSRM